MATRAEAKPVQHEDGEEEIDYEEGREIATYLNKVRHVPQ